YARFNEKSARFMGARGCSVSSYSAYGGADRIWHSGPDHSNFWLHGAAQHGQKRKPSSFALYDFFINQFSIDTDGYFRFLAGAGRGDDSRHGIGSYLPL